MKKIEIAEILYIMNNRTIKILLVWAGFKIQTPIVIRI